MPDNKERYGSQPRLALLMLVGALAAIFGTGIWSLLETTLSGHAAGAAAAASAIMLVAAAILQWPAIIMDDAPEKQGEASTMRIMTLAVVLTFCVLALYQGFTSSGMLSLKDQSEWIWLVTAAFGGKALQKYTEVEQKKAELKGTGGTREQPLQEVPGKELAEKITPIARTTSAAG